MRTLLPSFLVCVSLGCGAGDWGTVSGTVTLDDQPLDKGLVTFNPEAGGAAGYGQAQNGAFTIRTGTKEGLKAGKYVVTVLDNTVPQPGTAEKMKFLTPKKYADLATTDFKIEIKPGPNAVKLEMKSN